VLAAGPGVEVGRDVERRAVVTTLTPLAVYCAVLAVLLVVSWQTVAHFTEHPAGVPPLDFAGDWFWDGWVRLDSGWYTSIADQGYEYLPGRQSNVAFFPGYPLVVRAVSHVTGSTQLAGIAVTIVCGACAFVAFGRWCRGRLDPNETLVAVLCLAFYPYAYYLFGVMYGDALFLLLALAAFLAFERDHLLLAGVAGAAATATRFVGVAVVVGLVVGVLERRVVVRDAERGRWFRIDRTRLRELRPRDAGVLVSLAGIGAWCAYLWQRFGDPLAFSTVQEAWGQQSGPITWAKRDFFAALLRRPAELYTVGLVLQVAAAVLVALSVPAVGRRFGWRYAAYVAVVVALPVIGSQDFQGTGRYMLGAFPAFALAGAVLVDRDRLRRLVLPASAAVLVVFTALFANGRYLS
jgi:Dolichyl-phosphate-mannose-protein mannosyltransferase